MKNQSKSLWPQAIVLAILMADVIYQMMLHGEPVVFPHYDAYASLLSNGALFLLLWWGNFWAGFTHKNNSLT